MVSQRAKVTRLLEGDANTKYFQLVANGKHRKSRTFWLEQEEGVTCGDVELKKYITTYYKKLFGRPENSEVFVDESQHEDIPQVSTQKNEILVSTFSEEEVREAIFQMNHNSSPCPNGFPIEFYQVFWHVLKDDLMEMFNLLNSIRVLCLFVASILAR